MKLSAQEALQIIRTRQVVMIPVGIPGSGKSTLASELSRANSGHAKLMICSSDEIRKNDPQLTEEEVFEKFFRDAGQALQAGRSVYMDATHVRDTMRSASLLLAKREGAAALLIWMDALPLTEIPQSRMYRNVSPAIAAAILAHFEELRPEDFDAPWVSARDLLTVL